MFYHECDVFQYPQALIGESAQLRNIGCMMALPECDTQVLFVEKRQNNRFYQNLILYFQQTEMAFGWRP